MTTNIPPQAAPAEPEDAPQDDPKPPQQKGRGLLRLIAVALALVVAAPIVLSSQHIFEWAKSPTGLDLNPVFAVAAFVALDLAAVVCVAMTVYSSMKGETGGIFTVLTWVFAGGSAWINYQAAAETPSILDGPFFAAMSIAGPLLLEAVLHRLRKWYRQAEGTRSGAAAQFGNRWIVSPIETGRAWMASRRENIARPEDAIAYVRECKALASMNGLEQIRYAWSALGTRDEYSARVWLQARGQVVNSIDMDLAIGDRPRSPLTATQVREIGPADLVTQSAGTTDDPDPDPDRAPVPVPDALAADRAALATLTSKRDMVRHAFAAVGTYDVPQAVAWLAERGVKVARTDAYGVRKADQDKNRAATLRAVES